VAVLTISRMVGCFGDELAEEISRRLGYKLYDKYRMHERVSSYATDFSKEFGSIENESQPGFFERFIFDSNVYSDLIHGLIYDIASEDRVIIKGRGGHFVLADQPHVLKLRFFASEETRIQRVRTNLSIDKETAQKLVRNKESDRINFIRYIFDENLMKPDGYDLLINTDHLDFDSIVDLLVREVRSFEQKYPATQKSIDQLRRRALSKLIEATIQKEIPDAFEVGVLTANDGTVTISGQVSCEDEKSAAVAYAGRVKGVTQIVDELSVSSLFGI